jgi:predicted O-methyltransferase YrrM
MSNFPNWSAPIIDNFNNYFPLNSKKVLQIGVFTGDVTEWIVNNTSIDTIDDVDIWENIGDDGSQGFNDFNFDNVESFYDKKFSTNIKVKKHKMSSDMFFAMTPVQETYDFIYIDGSHTSVQTLLDSINGFRLLKVGGVLAFDDYEWDLEEDEWLRPKKGINSFLHLMHERVEVVHQGYQLWIKKIR